VQGFEVDVPAGWEATPTWKGFALRPADPARQGMLAEPVQVDTTYLEAFYNPAGKELYHDGSTPPAEGPFRIRQDWQSRGRFPDGRGWFRTDGVDGRWRTTHWYVSWSYHCPGGEPCPDVLAMRALRVALTADTAAAPEALALAERLLRSARPITNAVAGQAHAPRPDCLIDRSVVARRSVEAYPLIKGATTEVVFFWRFRTTRYLAPCALRFRLGVELLDGRGRADVRGNGVVMQLDAAMPEGPERESSRTGTASASLDWTNWCGPRSVRARWLDPLLGDAEVTDLPVPRCDDPTKPSVLAAQPTG